MNYRWIKWSPLPPIQLAFLVMALYYQIYCPSWLTCLLSSCLGMLLLKQFPQQTLCKVVMILALFAAVFVYRKHQLRQQLETQPLQVSQVALVPDSIRINGNQLAVIGRHGNHSYQLFYRFKHQMEARFFQKEYRWIVMHAKIVLDKAETSRNFRGFNYQSFLAYQGIYRIGKVEQVEQLEVVSPKSVGDYLSSLR